MSLQAAGPARPAVAAEALVTGAASAPRPARTEGPEVAGGAAVAEVAPAAVSEPVPQPVPVPSPVSPQVPDVSVLVGSQVTSVGRDGRSVVLVFTVAGDTRLRLRLHGAFRLGRGERVMLEDSDLTVRQKYVPHSSFGDCETLFDSRVVALNAILAAVRPAVTVAALSDGGSLRIGWGTSFRLDVPAAIGADGWRLLVDEG
ncbi:hypothetical protein [Streptomyces sp. SM12]|uniref:hypothetical protein n=1 Tax=Streptomyces sp. SM12 TaxID=1071602 RepID=UPI0011B05203|nr:hypothetical protein [Streptomyces sp. SM12]